jgi:hypothetical protein
MNALKTNPYTPSSPEGAGASQPPADLPPDGSSI